MPLAKDVSNAVGYGAVCLALWYGYSMSSNFYHFFNPEVCKYDGDPTLCINPLVDLDQGYRIQVHLTRELPIRKLKKPILELGFDLEDGFRAARDTHTVEVKIPVKKYKLHRNKTLYAVTIAEVVGGKSNGKQLWGATTLTHFGYPEAEKSSLFESEDKYDAQIKKNREVQPVAHWHGNLSIHMVADSTVYPKHGMPGDVRPFYTLENGGYLPALYMEELSVLHKMSKPLKDLDPKINKTLSLNITISPISLGKWRIYQQMERSLEGVKIQWGFGDPEIDQIKQLFCYTNHVLLAATLTVSLLHTLFSFLAMKNDIMYWRKRDTMSGLSASQIVFECVASYIVFLYLLDSDKGNKIVNFLCACECLIATWKLVKMVRLRKKSESSEKKAEKKDDSNIDIEAMTSEYDWLAIKYLGTTLLPFVIGYCIYSLLYEPHKSLLSWAITSMASVVYAIGFILMTPQLFINYKLKSVAHLPWRTLTYKAFNTFVDDLFSLVIDMPFLHRLACFRDDIVFFIFLYQWWLYGADKRRSYELDDEDDASKVKRTKSSEPMDIDEDDTTEKKSVEKKRDNDKGLRRRRKKKKHDR